jgi:tRNA nucleotidyltransferase (CCA-adding enzyme)
MASDKRLREQLWKYASQWSAVQPETTGDDLRKAGLRPSPIYGEILSTLRNAWLDGEVDAVEEEKALLDRLLSEVD